MDRWVNKVAVVTGASAGIGASICEKLVEHGVKVVGLARRTDRINDLSEKLKDKPGKLYAHKCDVSNVDEIPVAFQWIKDNIGPVEILINNAGIWRSGRLMDGDVKDWQDVLNTNVLGLCVCTKYALEQMEAIKSKAYIININSIVGHIPCIMNPPLSSMYNPSKFAVTCITEVLNQELRYNNKNIRVTSLSPGFVRTEIINAAREQLADIVDNIPYLLPEDISDSVIYLLSTPERVQIKELIITPSIIN